MNRLHWYLLDLLTNYIVAIASYWPPLEPNSCFGPLLMTNYISVKGRGKLSKLFFNVHKRSSGHSEARKWWNFGEPQEMSMKWHMRHGLGFLHLNIRSSLFHSRSLSHTHFLPLSLYLVCLTFTLESWVSDARFRSCLIPCGRGKLFIRCDISTSRHSQLWGESAFHKLGSHLKYKILHSK